MWLCLAFVDVQRLMSQSVVFVHGFTGHPRNTWTWKRTGSEPNKQPKRRHREEESTDPTRRSKFPRLSLSRRISQTTSIGASSITQASQTLTQETKIRETEEVDIKDRSDVFWPEDLACHTVPHSRILTYGYDTKVRHWFKGNVSKKTVYDHAWDLLCSLEALRRNTTEGSRPVLFVAHSLGGIVVKEALEKSRQCVSTKPHLYGIFQATVGILFFGTPHRGADPRNFLHHVLSASAQAMGAQVNNQIVSCLLPNNERLTRLRNEFSLMCHEKKWQVYSFQEEYGVKGLFGKKVVDDDSSCLDDPTVETKQHISSNHMDMCRFSGLNDPEYSKVAAAFTFILKTIEIGTDVPSVPQPLACEQGTDASLSASNGYITHDSPELREQDEEMSLAVETRSPGGETSRDVNRNIDAPTRQSLIEQLYFTKIDERLTSLAAAQGTTCRWFLSRPEYTSWRDETKQPEHGGFLWIKGNPGTGKSTLMKLLFEKAKLEARGNSSQITLSFFFLARGTVEEKSTVGLYRSLLHQLFEKAEDLRDSLEWMTLDGARGVQRNGWHEEALKQTLMNAVQRLGSRSLTIFVDALDECDKQQAAGMVCFFEELCDYANEDKLRLRICFSSRHYPTIIIQKGIEVTLEDQAEHTEDIRHYIKSKLRLGKSKQAELVHSEILEKSSGIFLWVVLVLDILNAEYPEKSISIKAIRNRLTDIPPELNDLFEMIMTRDGENLERLQICLNLILFTTRPLKPQELYFAIQLGLDKESSTYWDKEDVEITQMKSFVRSSSKGLAEVTRNKASEVQFIHESVRDFLFGRYGQSQSDAYGSFVGHAHNTLKECCLAQLDALADQAFVLRNSKPQLGEKWETVSSKIPFLEYSVLNVLQHADNAQQHGVGQDTFLYNFPLIRWVTLRNTKEIYEVRRYTESVSLLYILAELNLAGLIRIYPQNSTCFSFGNERYGPPILAALATKSQKAIETLISALDQPQESSSPIAIYEQFDEKKIEHVDFGRDFTFSPKKGICHYLKGQGAEMIFPAYLRTLDQAIIDKKNNAHQRTPFSYAAEYGHLPIVQGLLSTGQIHINRQDRLSRTALVYAAMNGHEAVVRVLLSADQIKINVMDESSRSAFSYAAENGHEAVVQIFLATGQVDVDSRSSSGRTPLSYAARKGFGGIVQVLLNTGQVEVDAKDSDGRTPLSHAAEKAHAGVVQLLLATNQVEVDAKGSDGRTPFSYAAEGGHEAIFRLLIATGQIDIDTKGASSRTPLSYAAEHGHLGVLQLLLATNQVDVDAKNKSSRTPFSYAAEGGHEAIFRLLIATGQIDIDAKDVSSRTPLSYAVGKGRENVARLLLETKRVNADPIYSNGWTPLLDTAFFGYDTIMSLLLATGQVNVNMVRDDEPYLGTPLSIAAQRGHDSIVRQLLAIDQVDINLSNKLGRTPLSYAAEGGHGNIVRQLLATNRAQSTRDVDGWSPSDYARRRGSNAVVQLLENYFGTDVIIAHENAIDEFISTND